jgi:hypothetical protein
MIRNKATISPTYFYMCEKVGILPNFGAKINGQGLATNSNILE